MTTSRPLVLAAALAALCAPALAAPPEAPAKPASPAVPAGPLAVRAKEDAVVEQARAWLEIVDAGKYADSWKASAEVFRTALPVEAWVKGLDGVRTPLGAVARRTLADHQRTTSLPGAPEGEYVVMRFTTDFAGKEGATETVTFRLEADGRWKAAGYFIR